MIPIEIVRVLYICSTAVAVSATIPQLMKLVRAKSSREMSLQSYGMWSASQSVTLLYTLTIGDLIMAASSVIWLTFYVTMTSLIIYYRRPRHVLAEIPIDSVSDSLVEQPTSAGVQ